jgi:hypothetical protein
MERLRHFEGARASASPGARLAAVRDRAAALRADLLAHAPVPYYRSRAPYPTRYALLNAATVATP